MGSVIFSRSTTSDDIPSTSSQAATTDSQKPKFKKFLDKSAKKSPQQIRRRILKRISTSNSANARKHVAKQILSSIKKGKQNSQNLTPQAALKTLRKRLNFAPNSSVKKAMVKNKQEQTKSKPPERSTTSATIEDGEIPSEDEDEKRKDEKDESKMPDNETDNDCICIESTVECITIDDEIEMEDHRLASSYQPIVQRIRKDRIKNQMMTSTPREKMKPSALSLAPGSPSYAAIVADGSISNTTKKPANDELFFEDVSRTNWLETITSDDNFSNYTKQSSTRGTGGGNNNSRKLNNSRNKQSQQQYTDRTTEIDEVIILDDSTLKPSSSYAPKKRKSSEMDDSVIFVSETTSNKLPSYIPLEAENVPNPIDIPLDPVTPKVKRPRCDDLFTKSEKKQLNEYNDNAYNPSAGEEVQSGKRMVIIDGSNVAFNHGLNKNFSVKGLKICIEYFEKMGHEVKAIVPQFRFNKYKSTDPEELTALHSAGKIVCTPCKNLPTTKSVSYDDRFVLQLACELDAAIVSNDNYRDLINENTAFKKIIENRVIGYTWCNDIFILPKDPYGKWGPTLHMILNR